MESSSAHPGSLIFEAFVLNDTRFDVQILWEHDKPLFRATDVAKILGILYIHSTLRSFDEDEKVLHNKHTLGGPQDTLFLTKKGLFRLLMRSRKEIARPFQKWVVDVLERIDESGRYELKEEAKKQAERAALHETEIERLLGEQALLKQNAADVARHEAFVQVMRKGNCLVYFGKIRMEDDGTFLVKIGSTKNMRERAIDLATTFGAIRIFEIFEVMAYTQFEDFLHEHPYLAARRFKEPIHDGHKSHREVFKMTEDEINTSVNIAKKNAPHFSDRATVQQLVELEMAKIKHAELLVEQQGEPEIDGGDENTLQILAEKIEKLSADMFTRNRNYTQARGPKVQRYTGDGELQATYNGYTEACRDDTLPRPTPNGIKNATRDRTLYKGFRWINLDRDSDDATVQEIGPTTTTQTAHIGLVAMLDLDKKNIVDVFQDMTAAAENRKFNGVSAISLAVKRGSISGGHYFKMWHDCDADLKEAFLARSTLPNPRKRKGSINVVRVNPLTEQEQEFGSIAEVQRKLRVSRLTLKSALVDNCILKGYRWKLVE